jgi:hypothetical protein
MKVPINVNQIRGHVLDPRALRAADETFTFYYDETYNPRRLALENGSTNAPVDECFVLGGVMHRGDTPPSFDWAALKKAMHIQNDIDDVKFHHVAGKKGDFLKRMRSRDLTRFLEWLVDSDFYVHFIALDKLYWSFVDLVDSVVPDGLLYLGPAYKSALDDLIRSDVDGFLAILDEFAYPNIKRDDADAFLLAVLNYMVERGAAASDDTRLHHFMGFLEQALGEEDLAFIMDEEDRTLIDNFTPFYINRISHFPRSRHIFDEEAQVAKRLSELAFMLDGDEIHPYTYVTSHDSDLTQVADVVAGAFGKFYSYLAATSFEDIRAARAAMAPVQVRNVRLLCQVMERTSEVSEGLLTSVVNPNFFDKKEIIKGA